MDFWAPSLKSKCQTLIGCPNNGAQFDKGGLQGCALYALIMEPLYPFNELETSKELCMFRTSPLFKQWRGGRPRRCSP